MFIFLTIVFWGMMSTDETSMHTSDGRILTSLADNPMGCEKKNEWNKTKMYPVVLIWKGFRKHSPQRKVIADKYLCLQNWNAWERQKSLFQFLLFLYPYWSECCNFHGAGGKRQASKSVITQKRGLGAIFVIHNLTLEGTKSNIQNCVHRRFTLIDLIIFEHLS